MQNRYLLGILAVVIIVTAFAFFFAGKTEANSIKIGAVLPLTGEGTIDQGQASKQAITLAAEKLNSEGGVLGKRVDVIFEDSHCDAKTGVTAVNKLISVDNVDFIIGDICDSVTAAIIPIAEQNKKILVTPGSTSPDISSAGDYIFRFWFSENDLGGMNAEKAHEIGYRKMAVIYIDNAWGEAQKNAVSGKFREMGGEIVGEEKAVESSDFRTILLKLEEKNPDSYYVGVHPFGLASIMKQMKELNISKQVFSHGGLVGSTQVIGLGTGGIMEGIISPFVYNPSSEFRNEFTARFNTEPGITADSSYDIVMSIAKIVKEKGKIDSEAIKNGLYELKNYPGVSGNLTIDKNGDTHRLLQLMIVRNGTLVPYE